jgi:uncharacterized protein DUF6779
VFRAIVVTLAVALGMAAIWLIVTSNTAKGTQIGTLLGLWALLLAAYPILGTRQPRAAQAGVELDVRPAGRVERIEDAAERVEYERRLQMMVRHEIHTALGSELANLRSEVAALRSEILEKVGGQIRLERIETTRMIGSDIEALQHEVRQLKGVGQLGGMGGGMGEFTVETAASASATFMQSMDDTVARQRAAAEAEHQLHLPNAAVPQPVRPPVAEAGDPFASMPRIPPFTDFDLDASDQSGAIEEADYAGRRRRGADPSYPVDGRHARGEADWATASPTGGRRRRDDDDDQDILARILEREASRP